MRMYTDSQARQHLAELLDHAKKEEILIRRKDGSTFALVPKQAPASPFDISGIRTKATTADILDAVRESRSI